MDAVQLPKGYRRVITPDAMAEELSFFIIIDGHSPAS